METLPKELLIQILQRLPDLEHVQKLILSSSSCYEAYRISQYSILHTHVEKLFSSPYNLREALLVIRSRELSFCSHKEEALALLDAWRRREEIKQLTLRSAAEKFTLEQPVNLEETIDLIHLHKQLRFFLDDYPTAISQPPWLERQQWEIDIRPHIQMSPVEQVRFLRALCRLYILKNLFGPIDRDSETSLDEELKLGFGPDHSVYSEGFHTFMDAYRCFYGIFPHWEHQEMGCVNRYLRDRLDPIYESIYNDFDKIVESGVDETLAENVGQNEIQIPLSARSFLLNGCFSRNASSSVSPWRLFEQRRQLTSLMISWGPDLAYELIKAPRERRWALVWNRLPIGSHPNYPTPHELFPGREIPVITPVEKIPHIYPADQHERRSDFRQFWSTLPATEQPSAGWKALCLGQEDLGLSYEWAMLSIDLNQVERDNWGWGYALWDEQRLKEWEFPRLEAQNQPAQLLLMAP